MVPEQFVFYNSNNLAIDYTDIAKSIENLERISTVASLFDRFLPRFYFSKIYTFGTITISGNEILIGSWAGSEPDMTISDHMAISDHMPCDMGDCFGVRAPDIGEPNQGFLLKPTSSEF